jgi:hypothetical protein
MPLLCESKMLVRAWVHQRARAPIGRFTTDHSVSCSPPVGQPALWAVCYAGSDRDRERVAGILVAESREVHRLNFPGYVWLGRGGGVQWETLWWWWRYLLLCFSTLGCRCKYPYPLCRCCILNHGYVLSLLHPSPLLLLLRHLNVVGGKRSPNPDPIPAPSSIQNTNRWCGTNKITGKRRGKKKHCTSPHAWCKKKKVPEISIHAHHLQHSEIMVGNLRSLVLDSSPQL